MLVLTVPREQKKTRMIPLKTDGPKKITTQLSPVGMTFPYQAKGIEITFRNFMRFTDEFCVGAGLNHIHVPVKSQDHLVLVCRKMDKLTEIMALGIGIEFREDIKLYPVSDLLLRNKILNGLSIVFQSNAIPNVDIRPLCEGVQFNRTLARLSIKNVNLIGETFFFEALAWNTGLTYLYLYNTTTSHVVHLANALRHNTSLSNLHLRDLKLTSVDALCDVAEELPYLKLSDITGNNIPLENRQTLTDRVNENYSNTVAIVVENVAGRDNYQVINEFFLNTIAVCTMATYATLHAQCVSYRKFPDGYTGPTVLLDNLRPVSSSTSTWEQLQQRIPGQLEEPGRFCLCREGPRAAVMFAWITLGDREIDGQPRQKRQRIKEVWEQGFDEWDLSVMPKDMIRKIIELC